MDRLGAKNLRVTRTTGGNIAAARETALSREGDRTEVVSSREALGK